ncbi:unnamed protein product [Urochloa decumbens]|uniref:Uncharacterized protein n=1 Tax=Urochloa decumbens TaxID=240449 RepID=A0ABC9BXZ7_9POAL
MVAAAVVSFFLRELAAPMDQRGTKLMVAGLFITMIAVGVGVLGLNSGGYDALGTLAVCYLGLIAGVNLISLGMLMADAGNVPPASPIDVVAGFVRRRLTWIGSITVSSALAAFAGKSSVIYYLGYTFVLALGMIVTVVGFLAPWRHPTRGGGGNNIK